MRLFCLIRISKFGSLMNSFPMFTSLSELYFRFKRFCCYKCKNPYLWATTAAEVAENHVDESGLNWYLQWGIYTSNPTWTNSQNSPAAAEAPSLKISSHGTFIKLIYFSPPSPSSFWLFLLFWISHKKRITTITKKEKGEHAS